MWPALAGSRRSSLRIQTLPTVLARWWSPLRQKTWSPGRRSAGQVVLPGMARGVLDRHLAQRRLPVTLAKRNPATPLLGSLDGESGITSKRLWAIVKRFFATAADVLGDANPALGEKLRRRLLIF